MKRVLKIIAYVAGFLLVALLLLLIILQSPKAQTYAVRKVIGMLEDKFDAIITVDKVHIRPFNAVVLKDVAIVDKAPYLDPDHPDVAPLDTFARARYITARISPLTLLRSGVIDLSEVYVEDGYFVITNEPDKKGNIKRIFKQEPKEPAPPKEPNDKEILRIGRVEIDGFRFRLRNFNSKRVLPPDAIDWADLDVSDIHLKGRKLKMHGKVVEGIADELSFREKSGMVMHHMSGIARVGNGQTHIDELRIRDVFSDLYFKEFQMTYADMKAFSHFLEEVRLDADIRNSRVNLETIGYFAPTLRKMSLVTTLDAKVNGYINDLNVKNFTFNALDSGLSARVDGSLIGLPDSKNMLLNYQLHDMTFTLGELEKFIQGWAPKVHLGLDKFAPGEKFTFNGTAVGPINRLAVDGAFTSGVGSFNTVLDLRNVTDPKRPILLGGTLNTRDLDVSRIAGIDAIGPVSLQAAVQASLTGGSPTITLDTLRVDRLHALGYDYTGIAANGVYSGNAFDGKIICNDPNLNFLFQGIFSLSPKTQNSVYKFYANVGYADLNALHLDKRGTSQISLSTNANFSRVEDGDMIGNIDIRDLRLTDEAGDHDIGDIAIASHINDDINRIRLDSKFIEGSYVGSAFVTEFIKDIQDLTTRQELPALFPGEKKEWSGNRYDLHFTTHDTHDILSYFKPGLYLADSTDIQLSVTREGVLDALVTSQRIALDDKYLKGVNLHLDNSDGALNALLQGDELSISPVMAKANRIQLLADDNHIGLGLTYDNDTEPANKGELFLSGELSRSERDSLILRADVLPSSIYLNGNPWAIRGDDINLFGSDIRVGTLTLDNGSQGLIVSGGYSSQHADTLNLQLNQFDLSALNPFLAGLDIQGKATGNAQLASPLKERIDLLAGITVAETALGGVPLGNLEIRSAWSDDRSGFNAMVRNQLDGIRNIDAQAFIASDFKTAEGHLALDKLNLGYAAPFLTSVFSEMGGYLSGDVDFSGPLSALELSSQDLRLEDALLKVGFTEVPYYASGPVSLTSQGLTFDNVRIRDRFNESGILRGGIGWDHFKDMRLNIGVDISEMEALNLPASAGQAFFGHVFATGRVRIAGPMNAIMLDVDAETAKEGNFHVPLGGAGKAGTSDLLTFKEPEREIWIDPYDLMRSNTPAAKSRRGNEFGIRLHIRPNAAVEAFVELDPESGNMLSGRGNGSIDVEVRPSTSLFSINGNYTLTDGLVHVSALNIARREFSIEDGSSIKFGGDIMDSDLDIQAIYRTKASIGTLIADTTSVNTRRTVECGIGITEKLSNPRVAFSINVPDLDPTTQGRVENALNSEDKIQKQFLSLLISGSFLPDETSGIVNNTNMLGSTVSEIMASQLSNILQKLDIPIDLGLDYQQTASGNDVFDLAVSTELFNNRVIVNGAIGNRQYNAGSSNQEVVGDLDIEIKLDQPGAFRLKLFSHSADQYTNYLDNLQRNGVGLTYQKEYNHFQEFLRSLFTRKKKETFIEAEEPERNRIRIEGTEEEEEEEPETEEVLSEEAVPDETL